MAFVSAALPCGKIYECKRAQLDSSLHTVGERILDFDYCDRAGESGGTLKCFTGVGIGGNEAPGYINAKGIRTWTP